jgi:hypothetical protein
VARLPSAAASNSSFHLSSWDAPRLDRRKAGRGFYERRKTASGETEIWALDPTSMECPAAAVAEAAVAGRVRIAALHERMRKLFEGKDRWPVSSHDSLLPHLRGRIALIFPTRLRMSIGRSAVGIRLADGTARARRRHRHQ